MSFHKCESRKDRFEAEAKPYQQYHHIYGKTENPAEKPLEFYPSVTLE